MVVIVKAHPFSGRGGYEPSRGTVNAIIGEGTENTKSPAPIEDNGIMQAEISMLTELTVTPYPVYSELMHLMGHISTNTGMTTARNENYGGEDS